MGFIESFLDKYFVYPIKYHTGYNVVNTLTYGIFLILAIFFVFRLFKRYKVNIDEKFFVSVIPFLFFGASTRALVDGGYYAFSYLLVTPGIYVLTLLLLVSAVLLFRSIEELSKKSSYKSHSSITLYRIPDYYIPTFLLGFFFCLPNVYLIINNVRTLMPLGIEILLTAVLTVLVCLSIKFFVPRIFSWINTLLISAHMWDAGATFIGIQFYGYIEQHVLPRLFIESFGAWTMFPLKLAVILPVVYIIDLEEDEQLKNIVKITIFALGFAPGTRDILRVIMGV
ncbi:MAG: DUF63 family protein [Candidatus Hydrothermarchaeota archaeon]